MQQRLAVAQTLIMQPKFLLLDEPFGALDPAGVTLIGLGFSDDALAPFAGAMHAAAACGMGQDRAAALPPADLPEISAEEAHAVNGAEDITSFGGWRAFSAART